MLEQLDWFEPEGEPEEEPRNYRCPLPASRCPSIQSFLLIMEFLPFRGVTQASLNTMGAA